MIKRMGVYVIRHNPSGMIYVGSSSDIDTRIRKHKNFLENGTHVNKKLQEAFDRDGNFVYLTVKITSDREEAFDLEQKMLDDYHPKGKLFNTAINARKSSKGLPTSSYQKQRVKEIHSGKVLSDLHKQKLLTANKNKIVSEETKKKLSAARQQRVTSDETRRKISEYNLANSSQRKKVVIDGLEYRSLTEAASKYGISIKSVRTRCFSSSEKYKNWELYEDMDDKKVILLN